MLKQFVFVISRSIKHSHCGQYKTCFPALMFSKCVRPRTTKAPLKFVNKECWCGCETIIWTCPSVRLCRDAKTFRVCYALHNVSLTDTTSAEWWYCFSENTIPHKCHSEAVATLQFKRNQWSLTRKAFRSMSSKTTGTHLINCLHVHWLKLSISCTTEVNCWESLPLLGSARVYRWRMKQTTFW